MLRAFRTSQLHNRFSKSKPFLNYHAYHTPAITGGGGNLPSLLNLCNDPRLLQQLQCRLILLGLHQNLSLAGHLTTRYAALGRGDLAGALLNSLRCPNSCLLLLGGDNYDLALPKFIRACPDIESVSQVHCYVIKRGFQSHLVVCNTLIEIYRDFQDIENVRNMFELMPERDLSSWNAMISGTTDPEERFVIFMRMIFEGFKPDSVSIMCILRSCIDLGWLQVGRCVHSMIVMNDLGGDLSLNTALLTMYCKLDSMEVSRKLFYIIQDKDCAVWNIMISGYVKQGYAEQAIELLINMAKSGVKADMFTVIAALDLAEELKSLKLGKAIHSFVIRNGSESSGCHSAVQNSLIQMYSRCCRIETARMVFDRLSEKTRFSWSSMIKGYVSNDHPKEALLLLSEMNKDGRLSPDAVTLINVLPACVVLARLEQIKNIHGFSIKHGINSSTSFSTALLVSYAKCGCIELAQKIFDEEDISRKDLVMWNSMIGAYAKHGNWTRCFELFNQMKNSALVKPDKHTFLGLLTACVNTGLVKEGWKHFNEMTEVYRYEPEQEHYGCMVDLLGRAGHLDKAMDLVERMPMEPDARVWGPLLSACKLHSNTDLAEVAARELIESEPTNPGNYILLSNIYASAGKWGDVAKMRNVLRSRSLKKNPGCSWLDINGSLHEFRAMDQSHPHTRDIYSMLAIMEQDIINNAKLLHQR